ncbi:MAG TPA: lysophospholipid acyltransferase family protein [Candidatus Dormibacteraeota bacterium]|nr:lysophospholipid acyltransferase family protein [Candidatus Dormibacteraeota bacterium]
MIERWLASAIAWLARLVTGATVEWRAGDLGPGQRVFIANHSSHADFVVLWSSLPRELRRSTRPVAARDYWGRGLARYLAERVFRAVLIDRRRSCPAAAGARTAVEEMVGAMGATDSLVLFPEGTRSLDGRLGEFRPGLYRLCLAKPGLQVVPVRLVNLNRVLPRGEVLPVPLLGRVVFGPPSSSRRGSRRPASWIAPGGRWRA